MRSTSSRCGPASRLPHHLANNHPVTPPIRPVIFLAPPRTSIRARPSRAAAVYATRVTRAASFVSTTSNSAHARVTSPAASGRSLPLFHRDSTTLPGSKASRFRTRNPRTGTATPNSTGNRKIRELNAVPAPASAACGLCTSACSWVAVAGEGGAPGKPAPGRGPAGVLTTAGAVAMPEIVAEGCPGTRQADWKELREDSLAKKSIFARRKKGPWLKPL